MKKEIFAAFMIISIFLISACDVYETLFLDETVGDVEEVPEGVIKIEVFEEEITDESISDEEGTGEEAEVEVEEEVAEDATVVIVDETEMISLVPQAHDPDNDALIFTFTSPLDENGEWQTTYGDNGEYTITVTASDGSLTASKEVLIIINKKEESPVLNSLVPEDTAIEISETETAEFRVEVSDVNNDELSYAWKVDGAEVGNEDSYTYETTYDSSGSHTLKITITDGVSDVENIWSVTVNNVNRNPVLQELGAIETGETESVIIVLDASDPDEDELSYGVDDDRFVQDGNTFTWETTYDDSGEYTVTVSASDGESEVSQQVEITVVNVNRPPVILDIVQK